MESEKPPSELSLPQPGGTDGRPLRGLAHWPLSRRCGWGLAHPPAQPRLAARQSASPGVSRCAVGWLLQQVKALALPVEANIYKQGLPLHVADSELSILIFQMGNSNPVWDEPCEGWGGEGLLQDRPAPSFSPCSVLPLGLGGTLCEPGFLSPLLWVSKEGRPHLTEPRACVQGQ